MGKGLCCITMLLASCLLASFAKTRDNGQCKWHCQIECVDSLSYHYRTSKGEGVLRLQSLPDTTYEIVHLIDGEIVSRWPLNYATYRFECGDLTGDCIPEIAVGTIKATHYHRKTDRRLFIFHLYKGRYIRPLWLGSRVAHPLLDFRIERDSMPAIIHTWELGPQGDTLQIAYRQKGFGLRFKEYLRE